MPNPKPLPGIIRTPCMKCKGPREHLGLGVCWDCMGPAERERLAHEDEGYFDVHPDAVFDDFSASGSEPLTSRAGWTEGPFEAVFVKPDAHVPEGHVVRWDKEWMIAGREYGVRVVDGVEMWWEKVDGVWTRRE